MTVSLLTPDLRRMFADITRRLGILERRLRTDTSADTGHEILFSYAGALTATESPPVRVLRGGDLSVLAVTLGTAGTTDTVLVIERNGATVATVTVPATWLVYNAAVGAHFTADSDKLTLRIATVGTGAADMTAEARFT